MKFLKNNLIAIVISLFVLGGISFANTYVRPYSSTNYAGGAKAVGAVVNAEFQAITDWLNGGNISSGNIAGLGVATANIDNSAVTTAKIADGAITNDKIGNGEVGQENLAAVNYTKTASSGSYTSSDTSAGVVVTNLTTTVLTQGNGSTVRPIFVTMETSANLGYVTKTGGTSGGYLAFYRSDIGTLSTMPVNIETADGLVDQCSAFSYLDTNPSNVLPFPSYYVTVWSPDGTVYVTNCILVVRQL